MTGKEVLKNTEKHTLLFFNKNYMQKDLILKEELNNFVYVEKLFLTKEIFYVQQSKEERKKDEIEM